MTTINRDIYLEIAKKSDNNTLLNMLSVNKNFNDEKTFKDILVRKYPNLLKHKDDTITWKQFLLKMLFYIANLDETYNYVFDASKNKNPEKLYKWYRLLAKFDKWRNIEVPMFEIYQSPNIYEMLYSSEGNGNHDTLGSNLINEGTWTQHMEDGYFQELQKFTPNAIFGEESVLYNLTHDIRMIDDLSDKTYHSYDYNYLLEILERNGKTLEEYAQALGKPVEYVETLIKNYPQLYVEKLKENPMMTNMKFLKKQISRKSYELVSFMFEEAELVYGSVKEFSLTDNEIDLILDLHQRVLNLPQSDKSINNDGVNILTEVTPENLA